MSIPLELQRKCEQRWTVRFARPAPSEPHKRHEPAKTVKKIDRAEAAGLEVCAAGLEVCPGGGTDEPLFAESETAVDSLFGLPAPLHVAASSPRPASANETLLDMREQEAAKRLASR